MPNFCSLRDQDFPHCLGLLLESALNLLKAITFFILHSCFLEGIIGSKNQTPSQSTKLFRNKQRAALHSSRLLVLSPQSQLGTNKELPSDQFKLQVSDLLPTAIFTL